MSETSTETATEVGGRCLLCGDVVGDLLFHLDEEHATVRQRTKTDILSWSDRVTKVIEALKAVQASDDVQRQIVHLDEQVIKPLYLVRARLTEMRRQQATEGSQK